MREDADEEEVVCERMPSFEGGDERCFQAYVSPFATPRLPVGAPVGSGKGAEDARSWCTIEAPVGVPRRVSSLRRAAVGAHLKAAKALGRRDVVETYDPQRDDECRLEVGWVVDVTRMFDDGWCNVTVLECDEDEWRGKSGCVPAQCLQAVEEKRRDASPSGARRKLRELDVRVAMRLESKSSGDATSSATGAQHNTANTTCLSPTSLTPPPAPSEHLARLRELDVRLARREISAGSYFRHRDGLRSRSVDDMKGCNGGADLSCFAEPMRPTSAGVGTREVEVLEERFARREITSRTFLREREGLRRRGVLMGC
ncbi:hypothetical protein HK101_004080 [Irineochytrium annulatum]|nr:hypothetical protein HK101_004080 [Irineochytrium annulatum]